MPILVAYAVGSAALISASASATQAAKSATGALVRGLTLAHLLAQLGWGPVTVGSAGVGAGGRVRVSGSQFQWQNDSG